MRLLLSSLPLTLWPSTVIAFPTFGFLPSAQRPGGDPHQAVLNPYHDIAPSHSGPVFPSKPGHHAASFVALGDSYSAGIGTGLDGPEDSCRHGVHAYPALIHEELVHRRGPNATSFQFLSCTGSTIDDMLEGSQTSQIDQLNTTLDADFALLSIGGNDLGFFDIMNSCIFRFYSMYSGTCESALQKSDEQLASPEFENHLRLAIMEILDKVQWEKKPWFTITVTGYARFFNTSTDECDDSSFGVWWRGPKLKRDLRLRMNEMVLQVNEKIKQSIDAINSDFAEPKVFFVDYDAEFEGHRFCEPNVTEPAYERNETWFFLVGGPDNANDTSDATTAQNSLVLSSSSALVDPNTCLPAAERSGDWGELALCMMAKAAREDPYLRTAEGGMFSENSMWYVPTYYGKTFHPRTQGHKAIRDKVYNLWEELHKKRQLLG